MKKIFQSIYDFLDKTGKLSGDEVRALMEMLKTADRELEITEFKLQRVEKERRTIEVLLEETITELQQKTDAVRQTNSMLEATLEDLKNTQQQLVFSEKMASLGELTAGVAHEIQNPLNFVINFANLTVELADELRADCANAMDSGKEAPLEDLHALMDDLIEIQGKILEHGTRAEKIVKSMLLHSRSSNGEKEPADITALLEETVTLVYQGMIGNNPEFRCDIRMELPEEVPDVHIIVQDIRSVLLNIFGNAFYAMNEKRKTGLEGYEPVLTVEGERREKGVVLVIRDNGPGIPEDIIEKVFNPFFTTKPAGIGTGLGLSLAYDMVKAHSGKLDVDSVPGESTSFRLYLPYSKSS